MVSSSVVKSFSTPQKWLGNLSPETTSWLVLGAADIALIVDDEGAIRDVALGSEELAQQDCGKWLDRQWSETVTVESREKVAALLDEASENQATRWRHINHPVKGDNDLPVRYSAVRLSDGGAIMAVGRELSSVAALQRRLVSTEQSIERDYAKLRHMETRYRLLFKTSSDAFVVVEASTRNILEANPAARRLLGAGHASKILVGHPLDDFFDDKSSKSIGRMLSRTEDKGTLSHAKTVTTRSDEEIFVSASLFRQENVKLFLIRFLPCDRKHEHTADLEFKPDLMAIMEHAPDGFVTTNVDGRIVIANKAFLDMAELASEDQADGQLLDRWLGRSGVDMNVLLSSLTKDGTVRSFSTTLNGEHGSTTKVDISCVSVTNEDRTFLGFTIRDISRADAVNTHQMLPLLHSSSEQLSDLVGRVPLKELVQESKDIIERLFIESALKVTDDNRAYAAEMLGLSRQSLYEKLRRHGLADFEPKAGNQSKRLDA